MDIYASPKIKATVKKVGSLIALIFYSSLIDFYYIGPYIHNTLSLIKFFTEKTSVKSQDVEKNFLDINVMLFDTLSFFNGFNRNFVKDMKTFLERDVVYNERLFFNLRGVSDSEHIMDICRQYSGGNEYSEVIKSGIIKPKIKSEEYIIIKPKPEDTIKVEQSETNMFRYLKYKKNVKKKMFLDEDINMMDFPEYIDDYERNLIKTNLAETLKIKHKESDILEVYDFINNIKNTKTNKDDQNIINQNTNNFFEENKNETTNNKNNKENKNNEFDFLSIFNGGDKDKNNTENKKENEKNKGKEEEYENIDSLFDFSQSQNNESTKSIKKEKKEEVKININNKNNKQSEKNENNKMLFNFDKFLGSKQSQISKNIKTGKKEENNKNKKRKNSPGLIDDELDNSAREEDLKSMEKNNILVNNKNKSDEKANINSKKVNENQNQNLFDFNIFNSMNNNTNNNLNNNGFNFNKANFTNPKNNSTVNQKNPINNSLNFNFSNFGFNNNNNQFGFFQQNEEGKIQVELKEEVCFYYNFKTGNKIINAMDKGYLGLLSEKEINKSKDFKINFLSKNFNNPQYIQKDSHIPTEKINDLNYKIKFNKMKKSEKLLEYIINPNILVKNRILEPFIGGEKNILKFGFMFNTNINKNIKKIELSVIYKNTILNNNMIQCDGKIMNNTSNQILVSYNEKVKEAKITYPLNINVFSIVSKITIIITLENDVMSDFDVEIIDMKSKCLLENVKSAQIRYEFS